ncbi:hypothetical protein [Intrasporangium sp.]|nr:hypothetical protein [Intrasporangium sp.]MDV3220671.1 hypothetical protein [Intrasporangium sp.]
MSTPTSTAAYVMGPYAAGLASADRLRPDGVGSTCGLIVARGHPRVAP